MQVEELHEQARVQADFLPGGAIRPVRFWRGHSEYVVRRLTRSWKERHGQGEKRYFNVTIGTPDIYQLLLETESMVWHLEAVLVDG